jgi:photosystem II stability/assembly factor-like uncharacterized protein
MLFCTRFGISLLLLLGSGEVLNSQTWSSGNLPRFRHGNDLQVLPGYKIVAVGGNESNDAITGIYSSTDSAKNWYLNSDIPQKPWLTSVDFITNQKGFACGDAGKLMVTIDGGDTWTDISLPGNAASRNYKSVYFVSESIGFLAGGNRSNDSIQTILKTTDGGSTWSILKDQPGSWLRSVFFVSDQNGFAVGDRGTLLKTVNGGTSWNQVTLPNSVKNRQLNSITFTNSQTGYIAGGYPANDSIQTILKTIDGGTTWSVQLDAVKSMLNDICFINPDTGYAVGDDGTVLHTVNAGNSWEKENIPEGINDSRHLWAVSFHDRYFGAAVGAYGKVLVFTDSIPVIPPPPPPGEKPGIDFLGMRLLDAGKIIFFINLKPMAQATTVSLNYGTTSALGTVTGGDLVYNGSETVPVTFTLEGLDPATTWYYRFVSTNAGGTTETVIRSFYPGYDIPNWDFEEWDTLNFVTLKHWNTGGKLGRIAKQDKNFAVELHSNIDSPGAVIYGDYKNGAFIGGVPFAGKPDSIVTFSNYQLSTGDTALVLLILKKNGLHFVDSIYKYTGSSSGSYARLAFGIRYKQDLTADSIIIAFTSTNFFSGTMDSTSFVVLDSIGFTGTAASIPNAGFNEWNEIRHFRPKQWISNDFYEMRLDTFTTSNSTGCYHGKLALRLSHAQTSYGYYYGNIRTGYEFLKPAFPVNARHSVLNAFVQFYPDGLDTLYMNINLFKAGQAIGYGFAYVDSLCEKYTMLSLPIIYNNEEIPDSAAISIMLGQPNKGSSASYAFIDALTFDAISVKINERTLPGSVKYFPNPANDFVSIRSNEIDGTTPLLELYDGSGHLIRVIRCAANSGNTYTFPLSGLPEGLYFARMTDETTIHSLPGTFKILVTH